MCGIQSAPGGIFLEMIGAKTGEKAQGHHFHHSAFPARKIFTSVKHGKSKIHYKFECIFSHIHSFNRRTISHPFHIQFPSHLSKKKCPHHYGLGQKQSQIAQFTAGHLPNKQLGLHLACSKRIGGLGPRRFWGHNGKNEGRRGIFFMGKHSKI